MLLVTYLRERGAAFGLRNAALFGYSRKKFFLVAILIIISLKQSLYV